MEILEAFDLTGSYRDAGELAGVSHHTVARYVAARDAGRLSDKPAARPQLIDEYLPKVEEWMDKSKGKIRADVAHCKLLALGYAGSERTTRRAVAAVRRSYRLGRTRVHRPWITEPGLWLQYLCRGPHRSTTSACSPSPPTPPKASTASSTPPTRNAPWPSRAICIRPASTNSCPRPSPPPRSTGYCTTPTSARPAANPSACPRPCPVGG